MPTPDHQGQAMPAKSAIALAIGGFAVLALYVVIDTTHVPRPPTAAPCTESWFGYLENNYFPFDYEEGHEPDFGDPIWFSSFEQKARLPDGSGLSKTLRCQRIQSELTHRTYIINRDLGLSFFF
jgi:hypothetical protein